MRDLSRSVCLLACLAAPLPTQGENLSLSFAHDRGQLVLSWPAWAADGILEQSTNPAVPASWTVISQEWYRADATGFKYGAALAEGSVFYRVRRTNSPVPDLICSWPLEEGTAPASADNGSPSVLQFTNVTWAAGRIGRSSLRFNGQNADAGGSRAWADNSGYRVLPADGRPFSVSLWFSPDALPGEVQELLGNSAAGTNRWRLTLSSPGPGTNFIAVTEAGSGASLSGRTLLVPGEWHQLVLTSAGGRAAVYLDSRPLAEGALGLVNGPGQLYLGASSAAFPGLRGRFDGLRVYTNALTSEQISLTGKWHFDENTANLAADSSIQGHLASIVSSAAWVPGKIGAGLD